MMEAPKQNDSSCITALLNKTYTLTMVRIRENKSYNMMLCKYFTVEILDSGENLAM